MKRWLQAMSVVVLVCVVAVVPADAGPKPPKAEKDDLPLSGRKDGVDWDVDALEKTESLLVLKRTVNRKEVVWLVQVQDDVEVDRLQWWTIRQHYTALFCDEDGVALTSVVLTPSQYDLRVGEKVRYTLRLPADDVLRNTKQVQIRIR
jgi:hypothetical protein